ncbi:YVTN family beta-propeller protein [Bradyrhizobium sp. i1.4.4]
MQTSRSTMMKSIFLAATMLATGSIAWAGQAPGALSGPDIPISHHDRVYAAEQFSNTVSVTDPVDNKLLGVIRLGDPQPGNFSPLYKGQVLVHGMGFSPDHKTLAVVSIGSNSVSFIDTATNAVKHITYVGRSPHEAFFTPDGKEVWVTVRGENYISVIDPISFKEKTRITTPNGPGMQIFSPDGKYGYICSSFNPETDVVAVAEHKIVATVKQESPFCPNIAATPDGNQVWFTLKDVGRTQVFNAKPPFNAIKTIDTGADHQPRQFRAHCQGHVRLRHHRWPERSKGVPHRRFLAGRNDPGRQSAARRLAVRRWHTHLCRAGERRRARGHRHGDQ